jgi:hypothetical protein
MVETDMQKGSNEGYIIVESKLHQIQSSRKALFDATSNVVLISC